MKVETIDAKHPTYDADRIERFAAMAEGGDRWRALVRTWIPQNAEEPDAVYRDRLKAAKYHNYAGSILAILGGYLFSKEPRTEGIDGDFYETLLGNCDRRGTPWASFWRERFRDALVGRQVFVWVQLPARPADAPEPTSLLDQERTGQLDAYLTPFTAAEVIDWDEDSQGALTWMMVRQVVSDRRDPLSPRTVVWRWTAITATTVQIWEWTPSKGRPRPRPQDDVVDKGAYQHNFGGLPVIRVDLPFDLWAMQLLYEPAVDHCQSRNDLTWALHRGAHATMWVKSDWEMDPPSVGPGYYIPLRINDEIGYVEPSGATTSILADDVKEKREEIYRVMNQMALSRSNDSSRIAASGASKEQDWQGSDVVMSAFAEIMLRAMRQTLQLIAGLRKDDPAPIAVKGLDGWHEMPLDQFLANAALATEAAKMSPTFRRELAKVEAARVLVDATAETITTIRDEIDAAPDELTDWVPPPLPGAKPPGKEPPPEA